MNRQLLWISALVFTLNAGGLTPDYGPTDWNAIGSTTQGFVVIGDYAETINICGEPAIGGLDDGTPTGACESGDCDIVAAMYNGQAIGWSHCTVSNGQISVAVNFNDFVTPGVENYPSAGALVTINVYDASTGLVHYGVTGSQLQIFPLSQTQAGVIDACGNGDTATDPAGCSYAFAPEFDPLATSGDVDLCTIEGCTNDPAINYHDIANVDDGSCLFAGCEDDTAANYQGDGYDCAGEGGADNGLCCTYAPVWTAGASCSNVTTAEGYDTPLVNCTWNDPTGGTEGDGWTYTYPDGGSDCSGGNGNCMQYDLGWCGSLDGDFCVTGGATTGEDGDPAGGDAVSECSTPGATAPCIPIPPDPANAAITDSGEGYITVSWDASYEADGYTVSVGGSDYSADGTSLTISPLAAGVEYCASVTADNSSGSSGSSDAGCATLAAISLGDGDLAYDEGGSSIGPFNALLSWSGGPAYGGQEASEYSYSLNGTSPLVGSYDTGGDLSYALYDLEPSTEYSFNVEACSQYGCITGSDFSIETLPPGNIPAWGFDVQVTFAALGQELVTDTYNRFGFSDEASDGFDPDWDYPEPMIEQPGSNVHFYFENDFSLETEWGTAWTNDIRKLDDDKYSTNELIIWEGRLTADIAGMAIIHCLPITAGSQLPASDVIPVYAEVNGHHYLISSGGMADDDEIPVNLEEGDMVSIRFIVGNLLPEAADDLSVVSQDLDDQSHYVDTPSIIASWSEDSSCDDINEESVAYDESAGSFEPATYSNIVCDSHEQRYSANAYQLDSHHTNDASDAASWNYEAGTDGSHSEEEGDLEYSTGYSYTIRAFNNAGEGGSDGSSATTAANLGNSAAATNSADTDANEAECTGDHCDTQMTDSNGDNVYTPSHDGDEASAPVEVTINGSATDPEDYPLDLVWGCVSGCEGVSPSPGSGTGGGEGEDDEASITSTFTIDNPYGNGPKTMTFELTATDDDWPTNGGNGSHSASGQVTIHVNAEQNQRPAANIAMSGDNDDCDDSDCGGGLGYWQVPHDGATGGTSTMTLSSASSSDPDAEDTRTFVWTESDPGTWFNDLNGNGILDPWESNSDNDNFDPEGFNPIQEDGEIHTGDELARELYPGGFAFGVVITDNYGDSHSAAVALYVHHESNDAALASGHNSSSSSFMDDEGLHYLPPGQDVTSVTISGASVSDAEGDDVHHRTSVNGGEYSSDDCSSDCNTGDVTMDFGVGTHDVTVCVQDAYEGYQYQELFNADGSALIETIDDCASYSFEVRAEPAPVAGSGLSATGGLYHVALTWDASVQGGEFAEFGENATSYVLERSSGDPTNESGYEAIGDISRNFSHNNCDRKDIEYGTFTLECDEPGFGAGDIDGELHYMGRDADACPDVPGLCTETTGGLVHFLDNWLDAGSTYYYRVTAYNSHGESGGQSTTVTVSTLEQPGVELTSPSAAQIWEEGADIPTAWSYTGGGAELVGAMNVSYSGSTHGTDNCTDDASDTSTGFDASGNANNGCAIAGISEQSDDNQEMTATIEDVGDYYGNNRGSYSSSSGSFTTSTTTLTKGFQRTGWFVFGSPLNAGEENPISVEELLTSGLDGAVVGSDYVYYTQDGNWGAAVFYQFGTGYFLGLQNELNSLEVSGGLLTSNGEIEAGADHGMEKGWNLVAPKLVRSVDVNKFIVSDGSQEFSWDEAQDHGLVAGEVYRTDADGYHETGSYDPWEGYWIHTSRALDLIVRPHSFDAGRDEKAEDVFAWNLQLRAQPVDDKGTGDIVKVGMHDNASDGFRYGEDSYDLPLGMDESYINLYMHRNWVGEEDVNGIVSESSIFYSDSREVITPDQAHVYEIQGTVTNITSDIRLSWNMDELDDAYKLTLLINGEAIDMRAENEIVVAADALHNMTVLIGDDPFAMADLPAAFGLSEAYPNPFNPMTSMQLSLNDDGYTSIKVYNLMGQVIDVIQEGMMQAGYHNVVWDAAVIPSGVYLVKVEQSENVATQKVMLMK